MFYFFPSFIAICVLKLVGVLRDVPGLKGNCVSVDTCVGGAVVVLVLLLARPGGML